MVYASSVGSQRDRHPVRVGAALWPQRTEWPAIEVATTLADRVGLDSIWTWDHLYAALGADPLQPIYEGWTALAAMAAVTRRAQLGLMVGANTFRNPGIAAKAAVTVDHISGGRTWLGLGGGWLEAEHSAHGLQFGSGHGQRLDWLEEAVGATVRLLHGETVSSAEGDHYAFRELRHRPLPLRGAGRLPIMIGGTGERKTLRTVARHAQGWNAGGPLEVMRHKVDVLQRHCEAVGRDLTDIEFTSNRYVVLRDDPEEALRVLRQLLDRHRISTDVSLEKDLLGSEKRVADAWRAHQELGFTHLIAELPAPFDLETIERLPRLRELLAAG